MSCERAVCRERKWAMPSILRRIDTHAKSLIKNSVSQISSTQEENPTPIFVDVDQVDNFNRQVGVVIRSYRKEADISQKELADSVNIPLNTLRSFENGETGVPLLVTLNICHRLHIELMDLLILISPKYLSENPDKSYCMREIFKRLRGSSLEIIRGTNLLLSLPKNKAQ